MPDGAWLQYAVSRGSSSLRTACEIKLDASPMSNSVPSLPHPQPGCIARPQAANQIGWTRWLPGLKTLRGYEAAWLRHDIVAGLVLFRWDAPLFFANAELFQERVLDAAAASPTQVRWLVVAAEPVTSVDVTAADILVELDETLHAAGIELCFAEMKDPVKDKLKRFGLFARLGEEMFFPTVGAAVSSYLETHAVDWVD
jgi:MFS superfamily sulfate permease-like transporter